MFKCLSVQFARFLSLFLMLSLPVLPFPDVVTFISSHVVFSCCSLCALPVPEIELQCCRCCSWSCAVFATVQLFACNQIIGYFLFVYFFPVETALFIKVTMENDVCLLEHSVDRAWSCKLWFFMPQIANDGQLPISASRVPVVHGSKMSY